MTADRPGPSALSPPCPGPHNRRVNVANAVVATVLRSPVHQLLSRSLDLIRYRGRRSGAELTTPTQYARSGNDIVILVGRPETKTWWRNFRTDHDVDVLVRKLALLRRR